MIIEAHSHVGNNITINFGFEGNIRCNYIFRIPSRMEFMICVKCGNYMNTGNYEEDEEYLPSPIYCDCKLSMFDIGDMNKFPLTSVITNEYIENERRRNIYNIAHPNSYPYNFKYSRFQEKDNDRYGIWSKYKMYKVFN